MLYRKVDCPHCGNEIVVYENKELIKCKWCRRPVSVKFIKRKGKNFNCIVNAEEFAEEYRPFNQNEGEIK